MRLLFFTLTCMALASMGIAKKCFTCSSFSKRENNCTDPFNKLPIHIEVCDFANSVCVKETTPAVGGPRDNVYRGCVAASYCKLPGRTSKFCETCEEDLCNGSSTFTYSLIFPFFILIRQVINA